MSQKFLNTALSLILVLAFLWQPIPILSQNTLNLASPFININISNQNWENWRSLLKPLTPEVDQKSVSQEAKSYVDFLVKSQINLKEELKEVDDYISQSQKKTLNFQNDEVYQLYQAIKKEIRQRLQISSQLS